MEINSVFSDKILDCFKDFLNGYEFEARVVRHSNFDDVWFENSKCNIRFLFDMGNIECDFFNPPDNFNIFLRYPAYLVWRFLYPNDETDFSCNPWGTIEEQSASIKKLLRERLTNVLEGDFSWAAAFMKNQQAISKKIRYIWNHLALNHPVYLMFTKGDPGWEKAFDSYHFLK